jgi:voltage-gated potassium channel Kch
MPWGDVEQFRVESKMAHVLVIGGTGKLSGFVRFVAARGNLVTVVSKDIEGLESLREVAAKAGEKVKTIAADYHDLDLLRTKLQESIHQDGPFQLAVVRIHPPSPTVRDAVAQFINANSPICRLFEVLSLEDHGSELEERTAAPQLARVLYRRILLGELEHKGVLRHPTAEEIAEAAIRAVRDDLHEIVIGELRRSA